MNFPGPINASLGSASAVSLDGEQFNFNSLSGIGPHGASGIVIPDKHLLFTGDYAREGNDLIISAPDQKYSVHDYFKGEKRPALVSEDGAMLAGHIVSSLTGYVQYAQASPPAAAQVIGHVMKLTGSASVIRSGVTVELNIGDAVQKGDVVQTGSDSSIALTLIDGSAFGMTSNARMALNEMVYDPNGSSNSSFISLVQGTVTFVAGQTAKNGNMRVETPVATMGIRGTAVLTKINLDLGTVEVSLGVEPDQHVGGLVFYDNTTGALIGTMTQAGRVTVFSPSGTGQPVTASEYQKSPDQVLSDKSLFNQVYQLAFPNFNPDDSKPKSTDKPRTDIGVPPNIQPKIGTDPSTGRPTITYTIPLPNSDPHNPTNINIIYVNTAPSFSVKNVFDVQATTAGLHSFKLGDQVTITDPDINTPPFNDIAVPYAGSGLLASASGPSSIAFGSFLYNSNLVSLNSATGVVTYNPEGFRFLGASETAVYKFTFVASSGPDSGALSLLLTILGQNDAPTIVTASTIATNSVKEDVGPVSGNLKTTGTITFQDFDLTDSHTAAFVTTSTSISTPLPGFVPNTTLLGTFSLTSVSENLTDTNDTGTIGWSFEVNNSNSIVQSLAEGQTITQNYKVTITDIHGVSVDQFIKVTITGTNDAPLLAHDTVAIHQTAEIANTTGAVSTVVDTTFGYLAFTDVDLTDTHQTSVALNTGPNAVVWSGGAYSGIPSATIAALGSALTAAIGTGSLNPDSTGTGAGAVKWDFSLPDSLFDFLGHSETLTLVYDVTVADYNNNLATGTSSTQQISVQITASNDRPIITAVDVTGAVQEDIGVVGVNQLHDTGSITFSDADQTDHETASVAFVSDAASSGATISPALHTALLSAFSLQNSSYNSNTGTVNWDFNIDNGLVQYLAAGETVTATYTISVKDDSGVLANNTSLTQTVQVTIAGTNDAPVVTAATLTGIAEDTSAPAGDLISNLFAGAKFTDVDHGATLKGIAIVGYTEDPAKGIWQYNDNVTQVGSPDWQDISVVGISAVNGLLLSATSSLRFVPAPDFNGPVPDLTVYGVDDTFTGPFSGASTYQLVTLSAPGSVGGQTPFSATTTTISTSITAVNDAPVAAGTATLAAIDEDTTSPAGATVSSLFSGNFSDAADAVAGGSSANTFAGIFISNYTPNAAKGDWQYSVNGTGPWTVLGVIDPSLSSLSITFSASDKLRFVPSHDYNGAATTLNAGLIESGVLIVSGGGVDLTAIGAPGGTSHYSTATVALNETINPVDDAPIAVLDTITNTSAPPGGGWVLNADNGHYYRYIEDLGNGISWTNAQAAATADGGYLATVTSAQESAFVYNLITDHTNGGTWIGGYGPNAANASSWYWSGGPEQGTLLTFTNWHAGEPNGDPTYTDAGLFINPDGTWNDVPTSFFDRFGGFGYVEEWGGQVGPLTFLEDTGTNITTAQLLANDTDVDNTPAQLSVTAVNATSAHGGAVTLNGNIITYHPAANYNGTDSFTYTLWDGSLTSTGTVSFNVAAVNDAPVLDLDVGNFTATGSGYASVLANDGNPFPIAFTAGLTDVDNTYAESATITLTDGQTGDFFFVPSPIASDYTISGNTPGSTVLTLSGHHTLADYAYALTQLGFGSTSSVLGDRHISVTVNDGLSDSNAAVATISVLNAPPALSGDGIGLTAMGTSAYGDSMKVADVALSDVGEGAGSSTVSAAADHGTVTYWNGSADVPLTSVSASVAGINLILENGFTYTPNTAPSAGNTDKLVLTVTDSHGSSDTLNFIFQQSSSASNATQLSGTAGKDLIFATDHNDTLFGDAGQDNFVFTTTNGQHEITDFSQGVDKIDLHLLPAFDAAGLAALLSGADHPDAGHTLLHLNGITGTILVNNNALTANDFIIHTA